MKLIYAGTPAYVIDLFPKEITLYELAPGQKIHLVRLQQNIEQPKNKTCVRYGRHYES